MAVLKERNIQFFLFLFILCLSTISSFVTPNIFLISKETMYMHVSKQSMKKMLYFSNSYPLQNVYIKDSLNLDSYEERTDKQMITEYIDSLLFRGFLRPE